MYQLVVTTYIHSYIVILIHSQYTLQDSIMALDSNKAVFDTKHTYG